MLSGAFITWARQSYSHVSANELVSKTYDHLGGNYFRLNAIVIPLLASALSRSPGGLPEFEAALSTFRRDSDALNALATELVDKPLAKILGSTVIAGAGAAFVTIAAPMLGYGTIGTTTVSVGGDGLVTGIAGVPMRSALGQENNIGTFAFDSAMGGTFSFAARGTAWAVSKMFGSRDVAPTTVPAGRGAVGGTGDLSTGSFSISDWSGYPARVPRPQGPFRLVEGAEYDAALAAKKAANKVYRREQGIAGPEFEVHEIHPVKFGGSATDVVNKVVLSRDVHRQQVTPWWNQLKSDLER